MTNQTITITPPVQETEYIIGSDLLGTLHTLPVFRKSSYDRFLLISDDTVYGHFGEIVLRSLQQLGKPVTASTVPPGEQSKRFETIASCIRPFMKAGLSRRSCVIALGGGMITDLAGFVASILLRGIDCIYLPTTLLAQVDAAIGGKTGVDFWLDADHMYKNMIGTIRQPAAVISDTDTLKTLPPSEITNGLGEIVKYWIGWGKPTLQQLQIVQTAFTSLSLGNSSLLPAGEGQVFDPEHIGSDRRDEVSHVIHECQSIKLNIIKQDPYETKGVREQLNLGHTIGHAVESAAHGKFSHGQAVAIGCVAAAHISTTMGLLDPTHCDTIESTVASLGLPTHAGAISADTVRERMRLDKKGGTFVLIRDIGRLETGMTVPDEIIMKIIQERTEKFPA